MLSRNEAGVIPSLSMQGVGMTFPTARNATGPFVALRDVNLDVRRHEFVTFIGHSGCGKSTLLNILAGLHRPTDGQVLLDGIGIRGPGPDRGVVFQNYSLLPWLTVNDNVWQAVVSVYEHTMTRA